MLPRDEKWQFTSLKMGSGDKVLRGLLAVILLTIFSSCTIAYGTRSNGKLMYKNTTHIFMDENNQVTSKTREYDATPDGTEIYESLYDDIEETPEPKY
jgi:hypothetical protein